MIKKIRSEIAKAVARKILLRAMITITTGGSGLLAFEGIESIFIAIEGISSIEDILEAAGITNAAAESAELAAEVTLVAESTAEVTGTTVEVGATAEQSKILQDIIGSTMLGAASAALSKLDAYFEKANLQNIQFKEQLKKEIQEAKKEEIQEINELKQRVQQTQDKNLQDERTRELTQKFDSLSQSIINNGQLRNSILTSLLVTYFAVQNLAMGDFIQGIEKNNPSILANISSNPELFIEYLDGDLDYEQFKQNLVNKTIENASSHIKEAVLERIS